MSLSGQWVARYTGANTGTIVIEIDEVGDHYEGAACVWDDDLARPSSLVRFRTPSKDPSQTMPGLPVVPMDSRGTYLSPEQLAAMLPAGFAYPATADVSFDLQGSTLSVQWTTPVGSFGGASAIAPKTRAGEESEIAPRSLRNWAAFKAYVNGLERRRYVFRGQEDNGWRLRSSFYRTARANMERFVITDMAALQKALSALTKYAFDLRNPLHYAAFINLAQHHGYPTPLLDWTWSPYVAAFFAYRELRSGGAKRGSKVRIFKLDLREWNKIPQIDKVFPARPHVSVLDAVAFDNPRVIPQQAISTISNVDDIETHIRLLEGIKGKVYLEAIDLPARDRQGVMDELALMGVNAGSLFPGLDGACESLRELNF
jgi:FRG domain